MPDNGVVLPSTKTIVDEVFYVLKEYSRLCATFPCNEHEYYMAFVGFRKHILEHTRVLLNLMDKCCQLLPKRRRVSLTHGDSSSLHLTEKQRISVMEAIDSLLESVDTVLDNLKGQKISSEDQLYVTFGTSLVPSTSVDLGNGSFAHVSHVIRPQLTFDIPVDNSESPFIPFYSDAKGILHTGEPYVHPFTKQIQEFSPSAEQLLPKTEILPVPLDSCPLHFIDTVTELEIMVSKDLFQVKEIAVDLEHHDYYSYLGFTCLMQISTRTADFIIDCLRLRSSMKLLAPVFLNPSIIKIFHGAREDVRWLQKDFSLYLVNFFDTAIALQTLHMPHSLAFAVDHFCQIKLCKKYQTADWRLRPLPAQMVDYARQDTHYLLYIYDRLKILLINSENRSSLGNLLLHVYEQSKRLSLNVYEKPRVDPYETYKIALGRSMSGLNHIQECVAREIFNWRDAAARKVDDSPSAVLPTSSILAIAAKLPSTARDFLRCCSPVSATVRKDVSYLIDLVRKTVSAAGAELPEKKAIPGSSDFKSEIAMIMSSLSQRSTGVYQPMTGTLPSIVSLGASPLSLSGVTGMGTEYIDDLAESTAPLCNKEPSYWTVAMRQLAKTLISRPVFYISLPGCNLPVCAQASDTPIGNTDRKRYVEKSTDATTNVDPEVAVKKEKVDASAQEYDKDDIDKPKALNERSERIVHDTLNEVKNEPTGAIALHQTHGAGPENRRKLEKRQRQV